MEKTVVMMCYEQLKESSGEKLAKSGVLPGFVGTVAGILKDDTPVEKKIVSIQRELNDVEKILGWEDEE